MPDTAKIPKFAKNAISAAVSSSARVASKAKSIAAYIEMKAEDIEVHEEDTLVRSVKDMIKTSDKSGSQVRKDIEFVIQLVKG